MHEEKDHLLTIPEFALALRIKTSCVRRWISEGRVTTIHVGRLVRLPGTEVERILRAGTKVATKGVTRAR